MRVCVCVHAFVSCVYLSSLRTLIRVRVPACMSSCELDIVHTCLRFVRAFVCACMRRCVPVCVSERVLECRHTCKACV